MDGAALRRKGWASFVTLVFLIQPAFADDFGDMDMGDMDDMGMDGMDGMGDMDMDGMGDSDYSDMGGGGQGGSGGHTARGSLRLDSATFDKIVGLEGYSVLVKFDEEFAFGDPVEEFKLLAPLAEKVPKFFVAEVQVGELDDEAPEDTSNSGLAARFGLTKADWPAYILFRDGEKVGRYDGSVSASLIAGWVRRFGIKMPSIGTIAELDDIAQHFVLSLSDADIKEAEKLAEDAYKDDSKAPIYVKTMKKILEKGVDYPAKETARLEKLLGGAVSEEKKAAFAEKLKILSSFLTPAGTAKEEL